LEVFFHIEFLYLQIMVYLVVAVVAVAALNSDHNRKQADGLC
jgi:hypothetical protein